MSDTNEDPPFYTHQLLTRLDSESIRSRVQELWTGREPFEGLNYHALLHQMTSAGFRVRPPMPGTAEWEITDEGSPPEPAPGYRNLIERCWNEDPSERPAFEDIVRDLSAGVQGLRSARRSRSLPLRNSNNSARNAIGASTVTPAIDIAGKTKQ